VYGERGDAYRVLMGTCGVKRPLGKPRIRRENNIKMEFQEVGWGLD